MATLLEALRYLFGLNALGWVVYRRATLAHAMAPTAAVARARVSGKVCIGDLATAEAGGLVFLSYGGASSPINVLSGSLSFQIASIQLQSTEAGLGTSAASMMRRQSQIRWGALTQCFGTQGR
jgi:hypothetical protein